MGKSEITIKRRIKENDLFIRQSYSKISDVDLDIIVKTTLKKFPKFGNYRYL